MNATQEIITQDRVSEAGEFTVAIAVHWPTEHGPGLFGARLLCNAVSSALTRAGAKFSSAGQVLAPTAAIAIAVVSERNHALQVLRQTAIDLQMLDLAEIAWHDPAEAYWRTVHPVSAPPFNRFLTEQVFEFSRLQTEIDLRAVFERMGVRLNEGEDGSKF